MNELWKHTARQRGAPWAEDCERWTDLFIEGEFSKLIIDLKWENRLLSHLLRCDNCKGAIRRMVEEDKGLEGDRRGNLFLRDLAERYKPFENALSEPYRRCPRFEDYSPTGIDPFIEDRIRWRITENKRIIEEAEAELRDMKATLR